MNQRTAPTFKLICDYSATGATTLDADVFSAVADAGFAGINLDLTANGPLPPDAPEAELRRIAADAAGLDRILSCGRDTPTDLTAADATRRADAIQSVIRLLDLAALLGASTLVIDPAHRTDQATKPADETYADIAARALDALLALRFEAELRGIVLGCRAISNGLLLSPIEARHFVDRLSLPFVGLDIDACGTTSTDLADYIRMLTHRISHVRIGCGVFVSDSAKGGAPSAIDIHIVEALREIGYDACLTISAGSTPREAMDYVRSVLTAIERNV